MDGGMGHYSCTTPSITKRLLWSKWVNVKGRWFYEIYICALNVICGLCDVMAIIYDAYCVNIYEVLLKDMMHGF